MMLTGRYNLKRSSLAQWAEGQMLVVLGSRIPEERHRY